MYKLPKCIKMCSNENCLKIRYGKTQFGIDREGLPVAQARNTGLEAAEQRRWYPFDCYLGCFLCHTETRGSFDTVHYSTDFHYAYFVLCNHRVMGVARRVSTLRLEEGNAARDS